MRYVAEVKVFQGMSQAGLMKPASSRVHAMGIQVVQCIQLLHGASRATTALPNTRRSDQVFDWRASLCYLR